MDMGSARCENGTSSMPETIATKSSGSILSKKRAHFNRPKFYPCLKCGRKFTIRALAVHKQSCTENEDCCCSACRSVPTSSSPDGKECESRNKVVHCSKNEGGELERSQTEGPSPGDEPMAVSSSTDTSAVKNGLNSAGNGSPLVQVSIVLPQNCSVPAGNCILENNATAVNNQNVSPSYFIIDRENEQCLGADVSSSNGLLLLHEAGLLSLAGVKLEALQDGASNKDCKQNGVPQQIMFSLPQLSSQMNENDTNLLENKTDKPVCSSGNEYACANRKLCCVICQIELPWELFGSHVVQHSGSADSQHLKCPKCLKSFTRSAMLLIHFYKHITDKPFVCKECHTSFRVCDDLKSHTLNVHGYMEVQPFHCYICLRRFSHPQTIINHMRIHSKETPFKCNECSRSFSQIGNLQRHMSVHRGDRPHKCHECDRSFADPATLRNHVRIHTGETPFVCKVCMRGFTQIGNLKRHMARHLQARPKNVATSPSSICSTQPALVISDENKEEFHYTSGSYFPFNDHPEATPAPPEPEVKQTANSPPQEKSNDDSKSVIVVDMKNENMAKETAIAISQLKEQRKKHHWQLFPCPVCGKVYTWQHDLSIHFRIHTGEKPYSCDLCGKRFAQSGAVRTHKARHHILSNS